MVILIDTNILLDVLMKRSPFDKASALVWKICETRKATGYISTLSYANIMYIMRKQLHESQIENIYEKSSDEYLSYINPDSLRIYPDAKIEPSLAEATEGDRFQFVRCGYFCKDPARENTFNLIVGLKDSYKPA